MPTCKKQKKATAAAAELLTEDQLAPLVDQSQAVGPEDPPGFGLVTTAKVVAIKDGDTIRVETRRVWDLRFNLCWAPEVHETRHGNEKALGLMAKAIIEKLVPLGASVVVRVVGHGEENLAQSTTMGRLVSEIWIGGKPLSKMMLASGVCFETKAELEAWMDSLPSDPTEAVEQVLRDLHERAKAKG